MDPTSGFIVVVGGKVIRIFRNVYEYQINADLLREKLKFASQDSVRQRLQQQLVEAEEAFLTCKKLYLKD